MRSLMFEIGIFSDGNSNILVVDLLIKKDFGYQLIDPYIVTRTRVLISGLICAALFSPSQLGQLPLQKSIKDKPL